MRLSRRSLLPTLDGVLLISVLAAAIAAVASLLEALTGHGLSDFPVGVAGDLSASLPRGVALGSVTAAVTAPVGLGYRLAWWTVGDAASVLVLAGAWILHQLVRTARDGAPFAAANVRRLRRLAALTLGYGALGAARPFVARVIQGRLGLPRPPLDVPGAPLIFATLLLALAQIWLRGVDLEVDRELTV